MPKAHPKPWHRGAVFVPPTIRRLCSAEQKAIRRAIYVACDQREPVRGGRRRHRLITPELRDAALAVVEAVAGTPQIARAALAGIARASVDTIDRALTFLERIGVLRRHPIIFRNRLGQTMQDASFYELVAGTPAAEAPGPQVAADSVPKCLSLVFAAYFAWKQAARGLRLMRRARKIFAGPAEAPGSGSDEWARWNAVRQIDALKGAASG